MDQGIGVATSCCDDAWGVRRGQLMCFSVKDGRLSKTVFLPPEGAEPRQEIVLARDKTRFWAPVLRKPEKQSVALMMVDRNQSEKSRLEAMSERDGSEEGERTEASTVQKNDEEERSDAAIEVQVRWRLRLAVAFGG